MDFTWFLLPLRTGKLEFSEPLTHITIHVIRLAAQRDCSAKLGYLVEFTTQAEQDQVVRYLQSNDNDLDVFWLGGRDASSEGLFSIFE